MPADKSFEPLTVAKLLDMEGWNSGERLLWWVLKLLCRGRSSCIPSLDDLAALTGDSKRTVSDRVRLLEEKGGVLAKRDGHNVRYFPHDPAKLQDLQSQSGRKRQDCRKRRLDLLSKMAESEAIHADIVTEVATGDSNHCAQQTQTQTITDSPDPDTDPDDLPSLDPDPIDKLLPSLFQKLEKKILDRFGSADSGVPETPSLSKSVPLPDLPYPYDITWLTKDDWGTLLELDRIPSLRSWVHNLQPGMMIRVFADGSFDPSLADPDAWEPTPDPLT